VRGEARLGREVGNCHSVTTHFFAGSKVERGLRAWRKGVQHAEGKPPPSGNVGTHLVGSAQLKKKEGKEGSRGKKKTTPTTEKELGRWLKKKLSEYSNGPITPFLHRRREKDHQKKREK